MSNGSPYILPGTYSNWGTFANDPQPLTLEALLKAKEEIKKYSGAPIVIPEDTPVEYLAVANCVECGTWAGCVCKRGEMRTYTCYLCGAQDDPRREAPRVCGKCRRLYL